MNQLKIRYHNCKTRHKPAWKDRPMKFTMHMQARLCTAISCCSWLYFVHFYSLFRSRVTSSIKKCFWYGWICDWNVHEKVKDYMSHLKKNKIEVTWPEKIKKFFYRYRYLLLLFISSKFRTSQVNSFRNIGLSKGHMTPYIRIFTVCFDL